MQIGSVIEWLSFPEPQFGGKRKPRWFLCLGQTHFPVDPECLFFHSLTTQEHEDNRRFVFSKFNYPSLREDCYLYYQEPHYVRSINFISQNHGNITQKCLVLKADLKTIYEGIKEHSNSHSKITLLDIHSSLNSIGLTGLKKP
jgi:hypothetical protein